MSALTYPLEDYSTSVTGSYRSDFHKWLCDSKSPDDQLYYFLKGYGIYWDRDGLEIPSHVIFECLNIKNSDSNKAKELSALARENLAGRVATLLDTKPEAKLLNSPDVIYKEKKYERRQELETLKGMLDLGAWLGRPDILAGPLTRMRDRFAASKSKPYWLDVSLMNAIITNQTDCSMEGQWNELLAKKKHSVFKSASFGTGFHGILYLPTQKPPTEAEKERLAEALVVYWPKLLKASEKHPIGNSEKVPEKDKSKEAMMTLSLSFARFSLPRDVNERMPELFKGDYLLNYAAAHRWPEIVTNEIRSFQDELSKEKTSKAAGRESLAGKGGAGKQSRGPRRASRDKAVVK